MRDRPLPAFMRRRGFHANSFAGSFATFSRRTRGLQPSCAVPNAMLCSNGTMTRPDSGQELSGTKASRLWRRAPRRFTNAGQTGQRVSGILYVGSAQCWHGGFGHSA
jgi:hypothetical protein